MKNEGLNLIPLTSIPIIEEGDELAKIIAQAIFEDSIILSEGVILVVAQKVVSKAEGQLVDLQTIEPSNEATALAEATGKDERLVELILQESKAILRSQTGVIITEHRTGHILANAGIDQSNVGGFANADNVLLWPRDPDDSARLLSLELSETFGFHIPVIINDSLGRPWRMGTVGFSIGSWGLQPIWDQNGEFDLSGRAMQNTSPAMADGIAAAASLVQGETNQGLPIVLVNGCALRPTSSATSRDLLRPDHLDMFR